MGTLCGEALKSGGQLVRKGKDQTGTSLRGMTFTSVKLRLDAICFVVLLISPLLFSIVQVSAVCTRNVNPSAALNRTGYELAQNPVARISRVDINPQSKVVVVGSEIEITIFARNDGGQAIEQDVQVAFPQGAESISVTDESRAMSHKIVWPGGEQIWARYGREKISPRYPLVCGWAGPWPAGAEYFLKVKAKPRGAGTFNCEVKTVAMAGSDYKCVSWDPATGTTDQQYEYVQVYAIEVLPKPKVRVYVYAIDDSNRQRGYSIETVTKIPGAEIRVAYGGSSQILTTGIGYPGPYVEVDADSDVTVTLFRSPPAWVFANYWDIYQVSWSEGASRTFNVGTTHKHVCASFKTGDFLDVSIEELIVEKSIYQRNEQVKMWVRFRNKGNIAIREYKAEFVIISPGGGRAFWDTKWGTLKIDPGGSDVLETSWYVPRDAESGFYTLQASVTVWENQGQTGKSATKSDKKTDLFQVVEVPSPDYPKDKWQRIWYVYSGDRNNPFGTCLGVDTHQTNLIFDQNWDGLVAYGLADRIGFISSRTVTVESAGTWKFTIGADDGVRLYVYDSSMKLVLEITEGWKDQVYQTYSKTISLARGEYKLRLEWYEAAGGARVSFDLSASGEQWVRFTPPADWVEISVDTSNPSRNVPVTVKITFLTAGYRVPDWGTASRTGNVFTSNAIIEKWTGAHTQAVTVLSNIYSLGSLSDGQYRFDFNANGNTVKAKEFTVGKGEPGSLSHFDLNYLGKGDLENPDGNDEHSIDVRPGTTLTMYFSYKEGNAGNQYIIRVYAEWDETHVMASSTCGGVLGEIGNEWSGGRWDMQRYTVPSMSGTYRIRVAYRGSSTPPTWNSYDRLLGEYTVTVASEEQWVKFTPPADWVEISVDTSNPSRDVRVTVKITFPTRGYRVLDWGTASRTGNVFTSNAIIEKWTGAQTQTPTVASNTYLLGPLHAGQYRFGLSANGNTVKIRDFEVHLSGPDIRIGKLKTGKETYRPGERITIEMLVENSGSAPSQGRIWYSLRAEYNLDFGRSKPANVGVIAPGETKSIEVPSDDQPIYGWDRGDGSFNIFARLDKVDDQSVKIDDFPRSVKIQIQIDKTMTLELTGDGVWGRIEGLKKGEERSYRIAIALTAYPGSEVVRYTHMELTIKRLDSGLLDWDEKVDVKLYHTGPSPANYQYVEFWTDKSWKSFEITVIHGSDESHNVYSTMPENTASGHRIQYTVSRWWIWYECRFSNVYVQY